ncbi:hypothetical protein D3870_14280 [Noviherbaspirillum cavernae]|uniref:Uncharacterized protein n=1 Tax=Noviherbaspirillum cavernae TaxID=2320862 RepID=A0A418X3H5_9BURK|nr:hypothetical protein D3870_14280 [Noviherbaspirillum cavernae]
MKRALPRGEEHFHVGDVNELAVFHDFSPLCPPFQGEGLGGDGLKIAMHQTHPPPDLPLEGEEPKRQPRTISCAHPRR